MFQLEQNIFPFSPKIHFSLICKQKLFVKTIILPNVLINTFVNTYYLLIIGFKCPYLAARL